MQKYFIILNIQCATGQKFSLMSFHKITPTKYLSITQLLDCEYFGHMKFSESMVCVCMYACMYLRVDNY